MNKFKFLFVVITILSCNLSTTMLAQDFLAFTALKSQGYGAYASGTGHTIPIGGICGINKAYYTLVSAEQSPFAGMNAALRLATGGSGFTNFNAKLAEHGYTLTDVEMKFTSMSLGSDIQNQDWFTIGVNETRFYQNGTFTFYVDDQPIVSGSMPILQIEIDYNTVTDCGDDFISGLTQETDLTDASGGQAVAIQEIVAALLLDVGDRGIRFNFGSMQAAAQGVTGAVFEATSGGSILLGDQFDDLSTAAISASVSTNTCHIPTTQVTSSGSGDWLHVLNGTDRVVSILDSENMGIITTEFYINDNSIRTTGSGLEYMDRNFTITPTVQPSADVRVRLYFTDDEWSDFIAAAPTDLDFMSEITITKFSSSDCTGMTNASGEVTVSLKEYGYIPSDNSYYVDIEVSSFSTFFIHGPKSTSVLPVDLTEFDGYFENNSVALNWQTANESNNRDFEIQRSNNGHEWSSIGWMSGQGHSNELVNYEFFDKDISTHSTLYYRLKQIDYDGQFEYSDIVVVQVFLSSRQDYSIFPNPVNDVLYFQKMKTEYSTAINLIDITGRIVYSTILSEGEEETLINCNSYEKGFYSLQIIEANTITTQKIIIQ